MVLVDSKNDLHLGPIHQRVTERAQSRSISKKKELDPRGSKLFDEQFSTGSFEGNR